MLVEERSTTPEEQERRGNDLVEQHLHLVDHIVRQMASTYPRHVDRDELRNAGALGLVDAARKFDPAAEVPFGRYAMIRIRGAVIDSVRARDWASRSVRREQRKRHEAVEAFAQEHGRAPTTEELADVLETTPDRIEAMRADVSAATLVWLDRPVRGEDGSRTLGENVTESDRSLLPQENLEAKEMSGTLHAAVALLPDPQRQVLQRVYFEGEAQRDIAASLGVTEARVSQIRAEGVAAIRAYVTTAMGVVSDVRAPQRGARHRTAFVHRMQDQTTWRERLDAPHVLSLTA